jgi:hypothetical protein
MQHPFDVFNLLLWMMHGRATRLFRAETSVGVPPSGHLARLTESRNLDVLALITEVSDVLLRTHRPMETEAERYRIFPSCNQPNHRGTSLLGAIMERGSHFRVHSPFFAMRSLSRRNEFVKLPVGSVCEITEAYDDLQRPGLVMVKLDGETFLMWARDLQQSCDPIESPLAEVAIVEESL